MTDFPTRILLATDGSEDAAFAACTARRVCGGGATAFILLEVAEPRRDDRSRVRGADAPPRTSRRQPAFRGAGPEDKGGRRRDRTGPPEVRSALRGDCVPS